MSASGGDFHRVSRVGYKLSKHAAKYFLHDLLFARGKHPLPTRLRKILEDLGPIYIKFGQAVSTRPELLPSSYLKELSKLQDQVTPFPVEQATEIIEEDLGHKPNVIFQQFSPEPVASASLAQVFKGKLDTGEEVAIKVRRPGVEDTLAEDISLLYRLARTVESITPAARKIRMTEAVREFENLISQELDFAQELDNYDRVRNKIQPQWNIQIPKVFPEYSTHRVLTIGWLEGIKVDEKDRLEEQGYDLGKVASTIGKSYLRQILKTGIFHSDPHPGNIFVLSENSIGLIDFGTIGELGQKERNQLAVLLKAAVDKNGMRIAEQLSRVGLLEKRDIRRVGKDINQLIEEYYRDRLEQIKMGRLLYEILNRIIRNYEVDLPFNYLALSRTAITAENLCENLDPEYRWPEALQGVYEMDLVLDTTISQVKEEVVDTFHLLAGFPKRIDRVLTSLEEGSLGGPTQRELEEMLDEFSPLGNITGLGLVVAALMVSGTFLWLNNSPTAGMVSWALSGVGMIRIVTWRLGR